jgi:hypothetical protein
MSYKINYKVIDDYLKVEITGSANFGRRETVSAISADVNRLVEEYNITKILVDGSSTEGRLGVFDAVEHIENYPPEMKLRQYAIIDKLEYKNKNNFFENYAINRGYRIYFFYDIREAEKWLNVEGYTQAEKILEKEY